ncbi:MAG TPA: helix-turn-helix transcriptional regulator [Thermodesulfobacteriota bacterium]
MRVRTPEDLGHFVRALRHELGVTQTELAMTSGTGLRFIVDLEKGKPTCQVGKVMQVLATLGATLEVYPPAGAAPVPGDKPPDRGD